MPSLLLVMVLFTVPLFYFISLVNMVVNFISGTSGGATARGGLQ